MGMIASTRRMVHLQRARPSACAVGLGREPTPSVASLSLSCERISVWGLREARSTARGEPGRPMLFGRYSSARQPLSS
jgi:hypothetical protein